ncbi:MAG: nucleotidyltransferase domain-containing protein [Chlamydiales bacterium]|nr:nucleotidyltransferase domain-containing protein [Chlamydiales bacterium]
MSLSPIQRPEETTSAKIFDCRRDFQILFSAILLTSRARGDYQPKSDYDVAVDCPKARRDEWIEIVQAIEKIPTLYAIQLVRLDTSSAQLQQEIAKEGIILYEC